MLNLGGGFKRYFEVVPALSPPLREAAFRIRHSVYCEDLGYEAVRPEGRETDEFDQQSLHCLVRNVHDGEFVACTRLIRTRPDNPFAPLPFEVACAATINRSIADPQRMPRHRIGEVSRLAVISKYRRRRGEQPPLGAISDESYGDSKRPRFPFLLVGLYLATIEIALRHEIDTIFVLTEPRLAEHFSRLGVTVTQIGAPVDHRGQRIASMMNCNAIVNGLSMITRPLYRVIAEDVERGLRGSNVNPAS